MRMGWSPVLEHGHLPPPDRSVLSMSRTILMLWLPEHSIVLKRQERTMVRWGISGVSRSLAVAAPSNGRTTLGSGDWIFVPTSGTTTVTDLDTDYLAGGVWLFVPANATSTADYVFGAFVDGNDPFDQSNIMTLQGTATYRGGAIGVYSATEGQSTEIGSFDGDVELTANFGGGNDLGTISGSLTNLEVDGDPVVSMLNFGTANIRITKQRLL